MAQCQLVRQKGVLASVDGGRASMAAWTDEEIISLIETYSGYSILWDPKNENHFKKNLKEDAWRDIGNAVNRPAEECKKKMIALLGSYRREKSKEKKKSCTTGKGATECYKSRWFAYEAFGFLRERDEPRQTLNTEMDYEEREDYEEPDNNGDMNQSNNESGQSSSTPNPAKRSGRNEHKQSSTMMSSAFQILKTAADKLNAPPSEDDEVTSFFKFVTTKVKTYSVQTKRRVQQAVFDIVMKADRGFYEWPPETGHYSSQQPGSAYGTTPTTGWSLQPACVFPTYPSQSQGKQLTTILHSPTQQGVSTIDSSIHAPTSSELLKDAINFSTMSPMSPSSQQSNISVGSDDFQDYV